MRGCRQWPHGGSSRDAAAAPPGRMFIHRHVGLNVLNCRVVGGWLGIRPHTVRTLPASGTGHAAGMQDHSGSQPPKPPPSAQPSAGPGAMPGESAGGTLPASLATPAITLRPATPADAEFCCRLHEAAMGDYITAAWGWDEQVQRAFHDRAFSPHRWQIITAGQASTGMLDIGCPPRRDLLVTHRDRPRPSAPRHRQPDRQGAPGGSRAHRPGPGSRRADGQPPRPSALPAAWPYRSRQPRRTGHQGHHAVRAAPEVATGAIAAKVRDLPLRHCRTPGLLNREGRGTRPASP